MKALVTFYKGKVMEGAFPEYYEYSCSPMSKLENNGHLAIEEMIT